MIRYCCQLAYDGTDFHGFQRQAGNLRTVQSVVETVLSELQGEEVRITGAGRTDAGVHAEGQVIHFDISREVVPIERFVRVANSRLPCDVSLLSVRVVPREFHARFSATSKTYRYRIWRRETPSPFYVRYSWHYPQELDWQAIQTAAGLFRGKQDFAALCAAGSSVTNTVRNVARAEWIQNGDFWEFWTSADGFLYKMVRAMVGLSVEVGRGFLRLSDLEQILQNKKRERRIYSAPPHGLCLMQVDYSFQETLDV